MKQETRDKISQTMKGRKPNNYGIPRSKEAKLKFKETIKKHIGFGKWNINKKVPQERKTKISNTLKGRIPKNLLFIHNLPRTEEWKRNISLSLKGRIVSEETKQKISKSKRNPLTPFYKAVSECYKSRQWREDIFRRDNYTCVLCRKRGGKLNADHFPLRFIDIIKKSKIKTIEDAMSCKELWNINNGRTLCFKCHCQTETYGNKFRGY